jgi:hypothetical protein
MPTVSTPAALPSHLEDLLSTRQSHVDAIATIDATLSRVSDALGIDDVTATVAKPALIAHAVANHAPVHKPVAPKVAAAAPKKKRGKASPFGISANDFVLAYVESAKNPSTQEINEHWKASGRPGTADNAMSMLTRGKKLKRTPLTGGQRGSRYSIA